MGVNLLNLLPDRGGELAAVTNQFVKDKLRGEANVCSQNPRSRKRNDAPASRRQHQASYEVTARTTKFLGKRAGNGRVQVGEPPPGGEVDDKLPF